MIIIFWDYDGTLVNTEVLYKKTIESYLENNGYLLKPISNEYFYKNISGRHPEVYLEDLQKNGYVQQNVEIEPTEIKDYYTLYFSKLENGQVKITKNIDEVIKKLSDVKDIIMCITSSSFIRDFSLKSKNLNNKIFNDNFDIDKNIYLCGSIENCNFKPSPDIFLYALGDITKKYNLKLNKNDELFIIEDSTAGCQAGKSFKSIINNKINVKVIGYLGSYDTIDNSKVLLENGADVIIKNADGLYKEILQ